MERRYSETARKRRRLCKGVVLVIMLLLFGRFLTGAMGNFMEGALKFGLEKACPLVFSYRESVKEDGQVSLWDKVFVPSVLAYMWEEDALMEEEDEQQQIPTYISVSPTQAVSLLQENIFQEKQEWGVENTQKPMEDSGIKIGTVLRNYDLSLYQDISQLIKEFYIVDASTAVDGNFLNIESLTDFDCTLEKSVDGPQILIYHSHSQEGFADSVEGDESTTIVGAGEKLARILQEKYGYQVLHHKGVYDVPSRDNAYSNALPAIEQLLKENPTIEVVIDLHRDAVAEGTKLVTTIDGKDYARFMFFNGICRSTNGPITYLNNPYLKENLAFSFRAQMVAESYFPGVTRKIYLKAWRYNMHLKPRNMLIELGAQTNTVEEIMNTTEILAFVIDKVLSGQQ